jgi:signal transduction histidine kinase
LASDVLHVIAARAPADGGGRAPAANSAAVSAELIKYLADDHDRIAQAINDVVVRRIFAAGLDLQTALALIGDHPAAGKIHHAVDELDQAIRNIRDAIFDPRP